MHETRISDEEYEVFDGYLKEWFPDLYEFTNKYDDSKMIKRVAAMYYYRTMKVKFEKPLPKEVIAAACISISFHGDIIDHRPQRMSSEHLSRLTGISELKISRGERQVCSTSTFLHWNVKNVKEYVTNVCSERSFPFYELFRDKDLKKYVKKVTWNKDSIEKVKQDTLKIIDLINEHNVLNCNTFLAVDTCKFISLKLNGSPIEAQYYCENTGLPVDEFADIFNSIVDFFGFHGLAILLRKRSS